MVSKDIIEIEFSSLRGLNISNSFDFFDECGLYFLSLIDNEKGRTCYSFKIVNKKKYLLAKLKYDI